MIIGLFGLLGQIELLLEEIKEKTGKNESQVI